MNAYQILTELLELPGIRVIGYEKNTPELIIKIESEWSCGVCPTCKRLIQERHSLNDTLWIRDVAMWQKPCWLEYRPQRFYCPSCQKLFDERVSWKELRCTRTLRYEEYLYKRCQKESVAQVARDEGWSEKTLHNVFEQRASQQISQRGYPLIKRLCCDEIALHKGHGNYCLVLYAPELGIVLDILPNRLKATLERWLDERGQEWCAHVEVFCADMWSAYHDVAAAKLPNAIAVVDLFHLIKLLNHALSETRRAIQRGLDRMARKLFKNIRWLLNRNASTLNEKQCFELEQMFALEPELAACYELKEELRAIFQAEHTPQTAAVALDRWIAQVEQSSYQAMKQFAKTLTQWRTTILNFFVKRQTNAFAEGVNLKLKLIARQGFGFPNFSHFRLRALVSFA